MKRSRPQRCVLTVGALATLLGAGTAVGSPSAFASHTDARASTETPVLSARCLDGTVPLSVEESRLDRTLPSNSDPAVLQHRSFAEQMIVGAGFQHFGPSFAKDLCGARTLRQADKLVKQRGRHLWRMAVNRAQGRSVRGTLPTSDDRPLYWTRLQATAALRQWTPGFRLSMGDRLALITTFDKAARGMTDLRFPAGRHTVRLIMSGFDPYTLDGGPNGTAPGATGNNIRHGNPSGAAALALDGTWSRSPKGKPQKMEAYVLPVNYTEFAQGYLEDAVGPFMEPGPRQVNASITMSQAGDSVFHLEQWNGRYHGTFPGNDLSLPCPTVNGVPQLAINNNGCNSTVVNRWGGPSAFTLFDPPQWTTTTLPIGPMIKANTGAGVPRPPGDEWPDTSVAFGVVWHTNYTEFPDCSSTAQVTRNTPVPTEYPPPVAPTPPDPGSCSYSGGGGNYLSNESAYRNTLLRDRMGLHIPAGHIHTPDMQHFETLYRASDGTFDAWRRAIVEQGLKLVKVVADNAS